MLGCRDSWLTSEVGVEVADAAGARVGAAAGDPEGAVAVAGDGPEVEAGIAAGGAGGEYDEELE